MDILLDTHTLLWAILDDERLSQNAKKLIIDPANTCYFSVASLWEITIKHSLGALDIKTGLAECFNIIVNTGFTELPINNEHLIVLDTLPYEHRDPFDRMLISQAIYEDIAIITADRLMPKYKVKVIW